MHNIISEFPSLPEDISHDSENGWNLEIPFPPLSKTETKSKKPGGVHGTSPRDGDKMPWSLQLNHLLWLTPVIHRSMRRKEGRVATFSRSFSLNLVPRAMLDSLRISHQEVAHKGHYRHYFKTLQGISFHLHGRNFSVLPDATVKSQTTSVHSTVRIHMGLCLQFSDWQTEAQVGLTWLPASEPPAKPGMQSLLPKVVDTLKRCLMGQVAVSHIFSALRTLAEDA